MKHFILTAKEDRELGSLGYMVEGTPVIQYPMVATEGLLISHDLLEHVNGVESIGSLDDELEAMAGVWFIRGQFGDISRNGRGGMCSPEENISSDLVNMACIYNSGINFRKPVPKTKPHYMDEVWLEIIDIAKEDIKYEIDTDEREQERLDYYFKSCLHLMRNGWTKINKRFRNYDASHINGLFWGIAETLEPYMEPSYEGQQIRLSFEVSTCRVYVDGYYGEREEY